MGTVIVLVAALLVGTFATPTAIDCALCSLAVNEVEGLLSEGLIEEAIAKALNADLCNHLDPLLKKTCDTVVTNLPQIITSLEAHDSVGDVCVKLDFCSNENPYSPDLTSVPKFNVDLDQPWEHHYKEAWAVPKFKAAAAALYEFIQRIVPPTVLKDIEKLGDLLLIEYPLEYAQEIRGGAPVLGVPEGFVSIMQLAYELSEMCTSIIAQTEDGHIIHARNLDFGIGLGFTEALRNLTVQIDYFHGKKPAYSVTTYAGYVGALTGMRPGGFAITANSRFTKNAHEPFWMAIKSLAEALLKLEAHKEINSFLIRTTLDRQRSWADAVKVLSDTTLVDPVYLIVSGVKPGEGVVITRNMTGGNVWPLDVNDGRWFVLQTNYDRWNSAPWEDNRRYYATKAMNAMGQKNITYDGLLGVLSTKPVLNRQTTYSILAQSSNATLDTWGRYCNDPCPM